MSVDIAIPSATWCPWSAVGRPYSYPVSCGQSFPLAIAKPDQSQTFEPFDQILPTLQRPLKRIRTGERLNPLLSSSEGLEDDRLFAPGYEQIPLIKITSEESMKTLHSRNSDSIGASMHANDTASRPGASPLSWIGLWITPREPEDPELVVSPLEAPPGFLEGVLKETCDIEKDPLGDTEMETGEEHNEDVRGSMPTETSSYTLERYLADGKGSIRSQEPSISRPDYLRSTDLVDIKRELQKITSDISDVFQGMNISDDNIPEINLQDLEASFGSENLEGLEGNTAECETDAQDMSEDGNDIFSLEDGDESVVVGPQDISPELESWISKSSLIVGSSLKPLVGGAVDSTGLTFQEEDVHFPIPHGRKRKASTCQ
ncbi:hypothetical protein TWF569_007408 [Orbilia oligospora]|uniref:Uncharacterized protein n=1 Tax=Orbilia oligospora TaxID=2813651 RepID=A0A7C8N8Q8_ORBOL|nr:hypothetical protein TWF102_000596 [Orbilia oligospora]KAF3084649.1 hypothetical protein TWF103_002361 [Orbilia oligospora]KAF3090092.1 hypothetical protein TWF706_010235 [Orbilia oligospora]KAF3135665.1 hypothetical protein TWF594_008384 [Orbilia oligospora]KAF3142998.1 hypothetical protein TWF569_007408 [Orbilia oligospora]